MKIEAYCNNCDAKKINQKEHWHCDACDFNLCSTCYKNKTQPNISSMLNGHNKKQKLNPEEEKQCPECNGEEKGQCLTCSKRTPRETEELDQHMADTQENAQLPENLD
jgi:hypothetical protein